MKNSATDINHPKDIDTFSGWQNKTAQFITSQTISLFGSSLVQYAIIWYITLETQSGVSMTVSTICGYLPQIIISLFAGVWADRHHRKSLIILADLMIAASTLILAVLFMFGINQIWMLFVALAIRSAGTGIQSPAVNAILPQLVPESSLMKVNGIQSTVQSVMLLLSPALGGALLNFAPLQIIFFVDVVTAVIGVALLSSISIPLHKKAQDSAFTSPLDDLKSGLNYVLQNRWIKNMLILYATLFFLLTPLIFLTPLMVARSFGAELWRLTLHELIFSAGSVLGGFIISFWGGFTSRIKTIATATIGYGVLTALMGLSPTFLFYLIAVSICGIVMPFFSTPVTALFQETVPQENQGRIFSLLEMASCTALPLGMLIFGPLSDFIKIEYLMVITGLFIVFTGILMVKDKSLNSIVKTSDPT